MPVAVIPGRLLVLPGAKLSQSDANDDHRRSKLEIRLERVGIRPCHRYMPPIATAQTTAVRETAAARPGEDRLRRRPAHCHKEHRHHRSRVTMFQPVQRAEQNGTWCEKLRMRGTLLKQVTEGYDRPNLHVFGNFLEFID